MRRRVLENGVVLLAYENRTTPSAVLIGSVDAGAQYEDDEPFGLAHMTAQALMRGCAAHDFDELHRRLEDIGADLQFSAGSHKVSFFGKSLAEDLPTLAETLAAVLRTPNFPEAEFRTLREETLTTLRYYQQDTGWRASDVFSRLLYPPEHPYHRDVIGQLETVTRLQTVDLRTFHKRVYGPKGLIITVVGDVVAEEALDFLAAQLADWQLDAPPPAPPRPMPLVPLPELRRANVHISGKTQTDIVMGVAGPSRYAADYLPANMANSVLGQFGMMGRVGASVRERYGYGYYTYSRLEGGFDRGAWCILAGVQPKYLEATISLLRQEIRELTNTPVSAEELADNQAYFKGRLPLQLETNEGIAGTLLTMESYGLGLDYLLEYDDLIDGIRREDVLEAMQRYWADERFVLATAGPEEKGS